MANQQRRKHRVWLKSGTRLLPSKTHPTSEPPLKASFHPRGPTTSPTVAFVIEQAFRHTGLWWAFRIHSATSHSRSVHPLQWLETINNGLLNIRWTVSYYQLLVGVWQITWLFELVSQSSTVACFECLSLIIYGNAVLYRTVINVLQPVQMK